MDCSRWQLDDDEMIAMEDFATGDIGIGWYGVDAVGPGALFYCRMILVALFTDVFWKQACGVRTRSLARLLKFTPSSTRRNMHIYLLVQLANDPQRPRVRTRTAHAAGSVV